MKNLTMTLAAIVISSHEKSYKYKLSSRIIEAVEGGDIAFL